MKISSKEGTVVLEYYPIKSWKSTIFPDKFLRVLSFKGDIMNKRIVTEDKMNEEIIDRVTNYTYNVTDNLLNLPQFFTLNEVTL
tara:strand:- start:312 stop:563 length:252 start_codon:yes stop_codon:yes gene_type:complete